MGSIRFPSQSDALSQATLNGDTLLPCRYKAGTVDDSDKAIPFNILQSSPVAVCNSSADMTNKIATVDNYPDFQLVNGREVVCYFVNGNTATNPSININGTGAISLEGSYWNAGTFLKLKYVDITVSGTRIQKWLIDLGSYNTKAQLNGALTNCLKKINNNISGTSEKDFIVNLASWLRSNISGSFILTGSWSNHYHYVAQGVVNSDDANFIVLFSQQAYICYYLYGVDVYVKQLNTTNV